jgi:5-bromo-4-chloroindolyl phosphate hydrolysis protein
MKKTIILSLLFFLFQTKNVFAYLDPGMISIVFQGIIGFLAATVATFVIYWNRIKDFLKNYFNKKNDKKRKN